MIEIREYLTETGQSPFADWLLGLKEPQTRARVLARLNRIRLGNLGDSKPIGQGIHELRLSFGPGYRIYFAREAGSVVLLLCAGTKRTQRKDIERARSCWRNYLNQSHD